MSNQTELGFIVTGGGLTLHLVVEGELLPGGDGPGGEQCYPGQAFVDVLYEHVVHL